MNENNYSKINKVITDTVNENIKKLQDIFPNAVKDGKLDVIALKEELGVFDELKKGDERYTLNWMGKQNAVKEYQKDLTGKTLKYAKGEGVNEENTQNIYIEGDNLEVLKLLKKNYNREIKMIYIDPPYNTGNDFVYNDDFSMSKEEAEKALGIRDEYNEKLKRNSSEDGRYHSNWLSMMYPRLKIARELLTDDGVIFISIDDHEQANLKKICDEIFGEDNFVAMFIVTSAPAGTQSSMNVSVQHSYCLCYAKKITNVYFAIKRTEGELKNRYLEKDENGKYYSERLWKRGVGGRKEDVPSLHFPVYFNPKSNQILIDKEYSNEVDFVKIIPYHTAGVLGRWTWSRNSMIEKRNQLHVKMVAGEYKLHKKVYESEDKGKLPFSIIGADIGRTEIGGLEVKKLFDGHKVFQYPKNVDFIKYFLSFYSNPSFIMLDFFSGSATTAHAVMKLNAEDGGNRKFIMVQLPELTYTIDKNGKETPNKESEEAYKAGYKNICEIGKERIRRAGKQIQQENPDKNIDIGFKVFKVDETTLNWEHQNLQGKDLIKNYKADSSDKDKLDFTPNFTDIDVVYEIMLRQEGLPLSAKIEQLTDIGNRTYYIAKSLVICLEENITKEMVEKLSKINPADNFIFRDSAFRDDINLKNETFASLSKQREKNFNRQDAYKVEFI